MSMFLRILFSIITIALGLYGLISSNFDYQPLMILSLGLTTLLIALEKFQEKRKLQGWFSLGLFLFLLFVFTQSFIV